MMNLSEKEKKQITAEIKNFAKELGFDSCGIAPANELTIEKEHLNEWLENKYNANMHYMERNTEKRCNPRELIENSASVISLAINYYSEPSFNPDNQYFISKYALGKDYHFIIKDKLFFLIKRLSELTGINEHRVFVDSAPVFERPWAVKAGLGWIGKNSNLIIPKRGSFFFLAEVLTSLELIYDKPFEGNYCGSCTKCIDACPTNAIIDNGIVDSCKCISYQTIESKEEIPAEIQSKLNNYVFGCDICQDVCPYNIKFSKQPEKTHFPAHREILELKKLDWHNLTPEHFNKIFKKTKSPLARTGYNKIMQNVFSLKKSQSKKKNS